MAKTVTRSQHRGDPSRKTQKKSSCCCKSWQKMSNFGTPKTHWLQLMQSFIQTAGFVQPFKLNLNEGHHTFKIVEPKLFLNATACTSIKHCLWMFDKPPAQRFFFPVLGCSHCVFISSWLQVQKKTKEDWKHVPHLSYTTRFKFESKNNYWNSLLNSFNQNADLI